MRRARIKPRSKIWIELDGRYLMGDGRAALLQAIDRCGSIIGAARELCISYRHAWGYIQKVESRLGMKIVETRRGGAQGGRTSLTKRGKDFLQKYLDFRAGINEEIDQRFARYFQRR
ncbi:MAG: LysR family transcriptional regulator [Planctomycetota bacterium]